MVENAIKRWEVNTTGLGLDTTLVLSDENKKEIQMNETSTFKIIWPEVKKIEILKPGKVVRVTVADPVSPMSYSRECIKPRSFKMICKDGDVFDLHAAVAIGIVKSLNLGLTAEGNEYYAKHFLAYYKDFNKIVTKAIKAYKKEIQEEENKKAREAEIKKIKERRRKKNAAKRKKKKGTKR